MENEILETVLADVLEELKEVKFQQARLVKGLHTLTEKVETFDQKVSNIKLSAPPVDTAPIELRLAGWMRKIAGAIEAQPKNVVKQFRILLFPEYDAREYYRIAFGRLFFWLLVFISVTYLFALGKQYMSSQDRVDRIQQYRKAWNYLYKNSTKKSRKTMDTAWFKVLK